METRRLRFVDGVAAPFRGLGFLARTPSMWPWALIPAVVLVATVSALATLGIWGAGSAIARLLPAPGSDVARFGTWLLRLVAYLLVALIALVIGFALAQPLSGPALERIVTGQERALGGRDHPPSAEGAHGGWSGALRSLRVTLVSLLITLPLLLLLTIVELAFAPAAIVTTPMKFAVSTMMVSWDLLDYPLSRRGFGVRRRVAWIADHFGATLGFGLSLSVLFLIPCAGLLLLPAGVAGAARLVVEEERHRTP